MTQLDLGIVVVSWNVRDLLQRCLRSIDASLAGSGISYQTVVVDNESHDGSVAMVQQRFPNVRIHANSTNRGFAGGNNDGPKALGLFAGVPDKPSPRYVLLLNPDTEVVGDALPKLVAYLDHHPEAVTAGPQLRYGDGTLQSSRRRFPTIASMFMESTLLEQWWPDNRWARRYRLEDRPATGAQVVDWLVGAALLVRVAAVERAGGLDERFFMYSEELEWQQRIRDTSPGASTQIVYLPDAIITHHEGRSSEQHIARRHINFNRSKLRYARLRWGLGVAMPLRLFLLLTYLVQALIEAGKWLLGHKRSLRAKRVQRYLRVLASGL